jgi:hypothetical protein
MAPSSLGTLRVFREFRATESGQARSCPFQKGPEIRLSNSVKSTLQSGKSGRFKRCRLWNDSRRVIARQSSKEQSGRSPTPAALLTPEPTFPQSKSPTVVSIVMRVAVTTPTM